jgi:general secretion pathway protein N
MRASIVVLWILIVAVAALVAFAPATWVDRRLAAATDGTIRLSDAAGTVWNGRGAVGDAQGNWRIPVAWRVAPLPLLRGVVEVALESQSVEQGPHGALTLASDDVDLRNVGIRIPASVVGTLASIKLPIEPGGELVLDAPRFRYRTNQVEGAFDIRWERARLATRESALELGTVNAHVAPQGPALVGAFGNVGGNARIDGNVNLASSAISFRADIAPNGAMPPDIARLLAALGTQDPSGTVHLQGSVRR